MTPFFHNLRGLIGGASATLLAVGLHKTYPVGGGFGLVAFLLPLLALALFVLDYLDKIEE